MTPKKYFSETWVANFFFFGTIQLFNMRVSAAVDGHPIVFEDMADLMGYCARKGIRATPGRVLGNNCLRVKIIEFVKK